jgi:hypothetical protein
MIYIYRREASIGARQLADVVGRRLQQNWRRVRQGDHVVCWGEHLADQPGGVTFLNNAPIRSKFTDVAMLREANVETIEVSRTVPQLAGVTEPAGPDPAVDLYNRARDLAEDFASLGDFRRGDVLAQGVTEARQLFENLRVALQAPPPVDIVHPGGPDPNWLGRTNNHTGGLDLLTPTNQPDYFAKKEEFVNEYRVHSFGGVSIRAGKKVPRENCAQHPWIRSWDGGWRISYDGDSVRQRHRNIAHAAVAALGLHFGAVDIGERADHSVVVLEVNRAPGLEGGTIDVYARKIREWAGQ